MKSISTYLVETELLLLALLAFTFVIKAALFFHFERGWDSLRFFHYTKVDLRMTTIRRLRTWRKRQNLLTAALLMIFLLFTMIYSFHWMVQAD